MDDNAKVALIHQLDDNLRAERRMWRQQDKELFDILSPLQVSSSRLQHVVVLVQSNFMLQMRQRSGLKDITQPEVCPVVSHSH